MEAAAERLLDLFRRNLVYLKTKLDYNLIRGYIIQYDILQGDVQETINAISTRGEQIEYLLSDALPRRPPTDVVLFAKVLIETKQGHHMEKIGVSTHDMEFIRGFNVDQTSHDVPGNTNQERPGEDKPLWDPSHPDGETFMITNELGDKLTKAADKLKDIVSTADLWAHLQRYGVMGFADVDRCKKANPAEADQVESIIDFLKKKEVWKVHAFFRSLAKTRQAAAIDVVLGPNGKAPYTRNLMD